MSRFFEMTTPRSTAISSKQLTSESLYVNAYPLQTKAGGTEFADLRRVAMVLRKHWRSVAMFACATVSIVGMVTIMLRPVYEPEGRLQIDSPGTEIFSLDTNRGEGSDSMYIATEAEKLQSPDLALATIRTLHLDQDGRSAGAHETMIASSDSARVLTSEERSALDGFRRNLSVERELGSRLVVVRFASHDPRVAAKVVNTIMQLFVERSYEARHDEIMRSCTWLARQLDDIRQKMEDSSRQLAAYQHTHGVADIDNTFNTVAQQVGDLNKQLADAQAQRIQLEAYLNRVNVDDSLPQMSADPVIQGLTQKQAEVSAELAQAQAVYGANHPNVRRLENQANELERQIRAQRNAIAAELKTSYSAAQARENLLTGEVGKATARLSHMEEYENLKKEAEANRQLYDTLYAKVKEAGIAAASRSSNIHVVDEAAVLDRPTRPHRTLNLLGALLFGLLGGVVLAFVKEGLEDRLFTAEEVRQWTGLFSIAVIPVIGNQDKKKFRLRLPHRTGSNGHGWPNHHSLLLDPPSQAPPPSEPEPQWRSRILIDQPNAPESEALNVLRTVLLLARRESSSHVFVVTSPLPGEGKTTVASNLAVALAKRGKTCFVDADLRRPQAALTFRLSPSKGLVDVLQETAPLEEAIYGVPGVENLSVLASVALMTEAADLITPSKIEPLIYDLRERFQFVVIDTPPILPYAEGRVLATLADGLIMVSRAAVTPRSAMTRSLELLNEIRSAPILTVVLNAADFRCPDYGYYYAGYRRSEAA